MPDVWATVGELDAATQARLADVLETRGADPRQQEMRQAFLGEIELRADARVLEVGCGTGVLTRALARVANAGSVVGVDLAPALIERARELSPDIRFDVADARSLPFADGSFDLAVFDSTLSHVPGPERALAEAFRVLRAEGPLAAFDGDYATTTVALGPDDPLQACVNAMMANSVTDRRVMRRLPGLLRSSGFEPLRTRSHGYVESGDAGYMLSIVERGADMLQAAGEIGDELAGALKAEARRRASVGIWFGHIAYVSVVARKQAA